MIKLIIPCAGLGTRVGMPFDKSKELNHHNGIPLIEFSLSIAKEVGLVPLVITRKEKIDLISFCKERNIDCQILDAPGKEWADTVLLSEAYWSDQNLFMLPDTVFENPEVIKEMLRDLSIGCSASFGVHHVEDQSKWSTINNYIISEKPNIIGNGIAWGCFTFKRNYGKVLFTAFTSKGFQLPLERCSFHSLKGFKDLTRESNIGI